ncbi:hypothetical protein D3C85_1349400 [compost metagenome]
MGPGRIAGVTDTLLAIEHHAAGAFEEQLILLQGGEVEYPLDHVVPQQRFQHALVTLQAAVVPLHRVEHQGAVGMAAPPVVGEDRIRGMRRGTVLRHQYLDTLLTQGRDIAVELLERTGLRFFCR